MSQTPSNRAKHWARDHTIEIISAIMLSIATIGSAWSAYQATRWSGVQAIRFSQAAASRAEAGRQTDIGLRKIGIDVGLFVQYAAARSQDNQLLTDFLFERFSPRLSRATRAWLDTKPLKNPDAPRSPFDMKEYVIVEIEKAERILAKAEQNTELAKIANQNGDNYVLLTVLFASVLFFAGVGTKFTSFTIRVVLLSLGCLLLTSAIVILWQFPVH